MLSPNRKEAIIRLLYASASDPQRHEDFLDELGTALDTSDGGSVLDWLDEHVGTASAIFERLYFQGGLQRRPGEIVESVIGPAALVTQTGSIVAANETWLEHMPDASLRDITNDTNTRTNIMNALRSFHEIMEDRTPFIKVSDHPVMRVLSLQKIPMLDARQANGATIMVRSIGTQWSEPMCQFLLDEFELSALELETIKELVAGKSLADIATETDRSRETIKSQTKSIYGKLDISGREDLVRFILHLQNLFSAQRAMGDALSRRQVHGAYYQLSSGRRFYVVEKGASEGKRFMFVHGLGLGHQFSAEFEDLLAANDLTALCFERPGYGRSDPPMNWRNGLEEWISLFPEICDRLDLSRTPLVTQTGGVMLATAAAANHPDLVSGICAFAAGIPITDSKSLRQYPRQIRLISRLANLSPGALRFVMMTASAYLKTRDGQEKLIRRTYGNGTIDEQAIRNADTHERIRQSFEMIAEGGFDGFIGDNLHMFGDWSRFPIRTKCEIAYLNGSDDEICPITWSRAFSATLPNMSVTELKGAGNLMMHTHAQGCIDHLLACLARFESGQASCSIKTS